MDFEYLFGWGSKLLDERIVCHSVIEALLLYFVSPFSSVIVLLLLNRLVADKEHGLLG